MKKPEHIKEAEAIGDDSYELTSYTALPKSASVREQVEALRSDQAWLWNHTDDICGQIDDLINSIDPARRHQ